MTATDSQAATLEHLKARGDWIPIRELAVWLRDELWLSQGQGEGDLRALVRAGVVERRATSDGLYRRYEYRAIPGAVARRFASSGEPRVARKIGGATRKGSELLRERILEELGTGKLLTTRELADRIGLVSTLSVGQALSRLWDAGQVWRFNGYRWGTVPPHRAPAP